MLAGLMSGVIVVLACYLATDCTAEARVLRRHDSWPTARLSRGWTMPVSDLVGRPRWVAYWFMAGVGALQLDIGQPDSAGPRQRSQDRLRPNAPVVRVGAVQDLVEEKQGRARLRQRHYLMQPFDLRVEPRHPARQ